jgi:hypothetical protein
MQHRGDPRREVQEMTSKVQDDNQKILAAMVGRKAAAAVARQERGRKAVSDGILGILDGTKTADEVLEEVQETQEVDTVKDAQNIVAAKVGVGPRSRKMTARERAVSGRKDPEVAALMAEADAIIARAKADGIEVNHDAGLQEGERPLSGTVEQPQEESMTTTTKEPRVLEDPVDNAKLIRMRAKWTAIRRERDVARCEEEMEAATTPAERKEVSGRMKTAKSVLVEAQVAERKAYKEYRDLLESRKVQAKAAKTASKTAETAVADPDDLDATINAQRESR